MDEMEFRIVHKEDEYEPKFYNFLKERKKRVLRRLIQDVRKDGGLPSDDTGIPKRAYTNQSETTNAVLASHKASLGYSKKDDISKTQCIKDVWQHVALTQEEELSKALYGGSSQFRLKA